MLGPATHTPWRLCQLRLAVSQSSISRGPTPSAAFFSMPIKPPLGPGSTLSFFAPSHQQLQVFKADLIPTFSEQDSLSQLSLAFTP